MAWLKPILGLPGLLDRNKEMTYDNNCPWRWDCPQHIFRDKCGVKYERDTPLPPKMKLLESPQPRVRVYQCGYCGAICLYDVTGRRLPEEERIYLKNPSFLGGRKVI